jgi:hypothetical protein
MDRICQFKIQTLVEVKLIDLEKVRSANRSAHTLTR